MLIIGLTGGIGSGKTTVSNLFKNLGVQIIDTDVIARELVDNDHSVLEEITDAFGKIILDDDGLLDRNILAKIVFSQEHKKQQLEKILHPKIRTKVEKAIKVYREKPDQPQYIIVVIPLLFETNFHQLIDKILVVIANEENKIKRIIQRDGRAPEDILSIIKSQVSDSKRISEADDIIENNSDIKELETKILGLHHKFSNTTNAEE
jgi:dephospho-CoA kinase